MQKKRRLVIILGFVFLFIGLIGIVIPILPTTPFVLLASACFSTSPKLKAWLSRSKIFGDYIKNYQERTGLKKSTIIISLIFLWTTLTISAILIGKIWACILLACVGIAVSIHILYMSLPKE